MAKRFRKKGIFNIQDFQDAVQPLVVSVNLSMSMETGDWQYVLNMSAHVLYGPPGPLEKMHTLKITT